MKPSTTWTSICAGKLEPSGLGQEIVPVPVLAEAEPELSVPVLEQSSGWLEMAASSSAHPPGALTVSELMLEGLSNLSRVQVCLLSSRLKMNKRSSPPMIQHALYPAEPASELLPSNAECEHEPQSAIARAAAKRFKELSDLPSRSSVGAEDDALLPRTFFAVSLHQV